MSSWEMQERVRRLQRAEASVRRDAALQRQLDSEASKHILAQAGRELDMAKEVTAAGSPAVGKMILASADRKLCQYANLRGMERPPRVGTVKERSTLFRDGAAGV